MFCFFGETSFFFPNCLLGGFCSLKWVVWRTRDMFASNETDEAGDQRTRESF